MVLTLVTQEKEWDKPQHVLVFADRGIKNKVTLAKFTRFSHILTQDRKYRPVRKESVLTS